MEKIRSGLFNFTMFSEILMNFMDIKSKKKIGIKSSQICLFQFLEKLKQIFGISAIGVMTSIFPIEVMAQTVEDSASVYKFVEAYQQIINTRDPAAIALFFADNADLMMFNLPEVSGRQAIEKWWRNVWQSKFNRQEPGRKGAITLNSVRFIADDIALANIETRTGGHDSLGNELHIREARGTWLLHRQNGNWFISAMRAMPTEKDSIVLGASIETARTLQPHVRAFVNDYEDAFNRHDSSAVTAFFRNDADIIVRDSPLIQGKKAIQEWWAAYFSKPRHYRALYIIDEIKTVSDEVVQVNFTATGAIPGTEGTQQPLRQTRAMWIIVRDEGKWLITSLRVLPSTYDRVIRY